MLPHCVLHHLLPSAPHLSNTHYSIQCIKNIPNLSPISWSLSAIGLTPLGNLSGSGTRALLESLCLDAQQSSIWINSYPTSFHLFNVYSYFKIYLWVLNFPNSIFYVWVYSDAFRAIHCYTCIQIIAHCLIPCGIIMFSCENVVTINRNWVKWLKQIGLNFRQ